MPSPAFGDFERPYLLLAPMQDVTGHGFLKVLSGYGGADAYITEYFRVHSTSKLEPHILKIIDDNPTGKPVMAQIIGEDLPAIRRSVRQLALHNIAGIDVNLGCPAPVVCKKNCGGGLLRDPAHIRAILECISSCYDGPLSVKTRLGYSSCEEFEGLLEVFADFKLHQLSVHARTVKERYQSQVHTGYLELARRRLGCALVANGNIVDVQTYAAWQRQAPVDGYMIGRGAIRNPWIFKQIKHYQLSGEILPMPTRREVLEYIHLLYMQLAQDSLQFEAKRHVQRMKRFLVYICQGLGEDLEQGVRRSQEQQELFAVLAAHLDDEARLPCRPQGDSKLFCAFEQLLER